MRPTLAALGLTAMLAQGCIVYEEHYIHDTGCDQGCNGSWTRDTDQDTDEPEPIPVLDLFFTEAQGTQGDTMLTTLRSNDASFDLTQITSVRFEQGVDVVDAIFRTDEVVLILDIADDATTGLVDAFVIRADGTPGLVGTPFEILPASATGDDDDATTGDDDDATTGDDDDTTTGDDDDTTTDTGTTTGDDDDGFPVCGTTTGDTGCDQ
jgi:hypothetical protein